LATYLKVAKGEQYLERPSKGGNRDIKAAPHVKKTRENKYRATTIPSFVWAQRTHYTECDAEKYTGLQSYGTSLLCMQSYTCACMVIMKVSAPQWANPPSSDIAPTRNHSTRGM